MAVIRENDGDAGADFGTRYTLSLGDVFQGALDPANDNDWVRVELIAGSIYDITLTGVESAQLQLLDSEGKHVVPGGSLPFDGAPHSSAETQQACQSSDLVIIPTSEGLDDLQPSVILANNPERVKSPSGGSFVRQHRGASTMAAPISRAVGRFGRVRDCYARLTAGFG